MQGDRLGSSFQFHHKMNHLFQISILLAQILVLQFTDYAINCTFKFCLINSLLNFFGIRLSVSVKLDIIKNIALQLRNLDHIAFGS